MTKLFKKPNKWGQVPIDCVNFNYCGKHCWANGDYEIKIMNLVEPIRDKKKLQVI